MIPRPEEQRPPNVIEEPSSRPFTPSHLYEERYFLSDCEGHENFEEGAETGVASPRLTAALKLVQLDPGERVLDVGCGRGEAVLCCARDQAVAYGVDYSTAALRIARRGLVTETAQVKQHVHFARTDAKHLPFGEASFDVVLMFDLVEHLYPWELAVALREVHRVLAVGGQLAIHTAPNRWYYRWGYPLYRLFERLRSRHLPADPRSRFPFHHLHVNEQDILRLRRSLRDAGFEPVVWLDQVQNSPLAGRSSLLTMVVRILLWMVPFRWIFRNDIFAVAYKRG